jgi:hypothetical protein
MEDTATALFGMGYSLCKAGKSLAILIGLMIPIAARQLAAPQNDPDCFNGFSLNRPNPRS